jgi:hypothetical protein
MKCSGSGGGVWLRGCRKGCDGGGVLTICGFCGSDAMGGRINLAELFRTSGCATGFTIIAAVEAGCAVVLLTWSSIAEGCAMVSEMSWG